ncbi:MAG: phosphoribosyltransferase [Desulfobacteraceae bacterium]|nr:MAG: phosphoribosyltransferase [Desulfobacteraceae bacterium]
MLAEMLACCRQESFTAMAIPAGGVPVGKTVAERLGIPFDVAVVSKITFPWNTEAGYGAVAFDGTVRLNSRLVERMGLSETDVRAGIEKTVRKVKRRMKTFFGNRPFPEFAGQSIVLIDDGVASGFTMRTAVEAVKKLSAARLIVAVPTAHRESMGSIAASVDALFCPNIRSGPGYAVAEAYEHWTDVDEEEAVRLLLDAISAAG